MPRGTVCLLQRVIAGLLVLAILLCAGTPVVMAMAPQPPVGSTAGQVIAVAAHDVTTPMRDGGCCHGLPCCIDGQCALHGYWVLTGAVTTPDRLARAVAVPAVRQPELSGIALCPSAPPPRGAA